MVVLTEKEVAAMQLVADVQFGSTWARMSTLLAEADRPSSRVIFSDGLVSRHEILDALASPEREGLVEFREDRERGLLVRLTGDGLRCQEIIVDWL